MFEEEDIIGWKWAAAGMKLIGWKEECASFVGC